MDGRFTYVGVGMVGSVHDLSVLKQCWEEPNFPHPPHGRYYLVALDTYWSLDTWVLSKIQGVTNAKVYVQLQVACGLVQPKICPSSLLCGFMKATSFVNVACMRNCITMDWSNM